MHTFTGQDVFGTSAEYNIDSNLVLNCFVEGRHSCGCFTQKEAWIVSAAVTVSALIYAWSCVIHSLTSKMFAPGYLAFVIFLNAELEIQLNLSKGTTGISFAELPGKEACDAQVLNIGTHASCYSVFKCYGWLCNIVCTGACDAFETYVWLRQADAKREVSGILIFHCGCFSVGSLWPFILPVFLEYCKLWPLPARFLYWLFIPYHSLDTLNKGRQHRAKEHWCHGKEAMILHIFPLTLCCSFICTRVFV